MATIVVVRHGATAYNVSPERVRGWEDVPLTEEGKHEAQALAKKVNRNFNVGRVFTSDLARAKYTASQIAKTSKCLMEPMSGLRPWNLGKLTGKPVKEVTPEMKAFITHPDEPVPGGESLNDFITRFMKAWHEILGRAETAHRDTAVVTHTRGVRAILGWLTAGADGDVDDKFLLDEEDPVDPSGYLALSDKSGRWKIVAQDKGH